MESYSPLEISEIEEILNKRFLVGSSFSATNLQIEVEKNYFFNSSKGDPTEAYVVTFFLNKDGQPVDFPPYPFSNKTDTKDVAFHVAHEIWVRFDNSLDSKIWKNFDPKTI